VPPHKKKSTGEPSRRSGSPEERKGIRVKNSLGRIPATT